MEFSSTQGGIFPAIDMQILIEYLVQYFVASLRIGAFLITSPFMGSRSIMPTVRVMLALVMTVLIAGKVPVPDSAVIGSAFGVALIVKEIAIGLFAGLILTIWFSAASLAGEKVATSAGLGYASMMDPDAGGQTPVVGRLFSLFLIVIFLSLDGHLMAIAIMMRSYEFAPIGEMQSLLGLIEAGVAVAGYMFLAAALIMLPIITVMLMINIAIGIITRSAPQLNLFSFGFPISMLGVFFVLYISAGVLGFAFSDLVDSALSDIEITIGGLSSGE
ncbi:flagellar biosynthetic protein FliR [Alphaproteobacteria bacterium]|nr:flagellar biosynthetic protein FliR [Alphaproteobacteria bacterium]